MKNSGLANVIGCDTPACCAYRVVDGTLAPDTSLLEESVLKIALAIAKAVDDMAMADKIDSLKVSVLVK